MRSRADFDFALALVLLLRTAAHRMANLDQVHKLLDGGYSNMPQPQDTEK